jgi:hypothetical protein
MCLEMVDCGEECTRPNEEEWASLSRYARLRISSNVQDCVETHFEKNCGAWENVKACNSEGDVGRRTDDALTDIGNVD